MSQPVLYFLAQHVPGTSDKGLHITLALIHKARFDEDPANAKKDMAELAEAILPLPKPSDKEARRQKSPRAE